MPSDSGSPTPDAGDVDRLLDIHIFIDRDGGTGCTVRMGNMRSIDEERALFRQAADMLANAQGRQEPPHD